MEKVLHRHVHEMSRIIFFSVQSRTFDSCNVNPTIKRVKNKNFNVPKNIS